MLTRRTYGSGPGLTSIHRESERDCLAIRAKVDRVEDILELHVGLGEVLVSKLLQKVTGQCETKPVDLLSEQHRQGWSGSLILVDEVDPIIEVLG